MVKLFFSLSARLMASLFRPTPQSPFLSNLGILTKKGKVKDADMEAMPASEQTVTN